MPRKFQIIEVPSDIPREQEQMGTKFKFWYEDKEHGYCLFKEGHRNTGEDWAERIAAELCELIELPYAKYKLAVWQNRRGVITPKFIDEDEILVPGNEVLFGRDENYPKQQRFRVRKHNIETIFNTFEPLEVQLPVEHTAANITTAQQVFVGYLMLDAWIGNTDRHHENWALVRRFENGVLTNRLAPTHDHAASFGCVLQDEEKQERLITKDRGRTVEAYVQSAKARSAVFGNETDSKPLSLIDAFRLASAYNPDASKIWLDKLEGVTIEDVTEVFERIPESLISSVSKHFAVQMLGINRRRLLELKR